MNALVKIFSIQDADDLRHVMHCVEGLSGNPAQCIQWGEPGNIDVVALIAITLIDILQNCNKQPMFACEVLVEKAFIEPRLLNDRV